MAELLDENKVGIDYFGQNNMMYDPASDSYKLVDLNYVDDPKSAFEWNKLDKPVKQRLEDKFGYEIPQGDLPLELEFANSKSIKPMLGDKIGDNTGKFNLGVYNFKDHPQYIAKVEDPAAVAATQGLDADQYINAMVERTKNLDPSQFAKVLKTVEGKEGKRLLVMPKLRGTLGSKLDTDLLQSIPDQSYENFYNNLKLLRDEGLNYDFIGDNFMYDPYTEQFNIFDLSPQSNRTVEPESGNEYFFETQVFGKGNPGIYGKEQAGENLKDAMRQKLTRTYMETFPGDEEMYGLDEYTQRIDAILKGLNPQRYGGVQF
jgi:7,8-dihydro-6-hydroxymethylpterin-pyrophosphokinase